MIAPSLKQRPTSNIHLKQLRVRAIASDVGVVIIDLNERPKRVTSRAVAKFVQEWSRFLLAL
jgi:hypothetical protein